MIKYALSQLKRGIRLAPRVLAASLILVLSLALLGYMLSVLGASRAEDAIVRIAICGDTDDHYFPLALELLKGGDFSRYSMSFELMEESEAEAQLRSGLLAGYIRVPEGFVPSLSDGRRLHVTYVTTASGGLGNLLTGEIAEVVAALLTETENAVYGTQRYSYRNFPGRNGYQDGMDLAAKYVGAILSREELFSVSVLGYTGSLSLYGSFFCGLSIAAFLLVSLGAAPYFTLRSRALTDILPISPFSQIISELFGALPLTLAAFLLTVAAGSLFTGLVPELSSLSAPQLIAAAVSAFPAAIMLSTMAQLIFEIAPDPAGGLMLSFLNIILQGLLAGLFFPSSMLPGGLSHVGSFLPAGAVLNLCAASVKYGAAAAEAIPVLGWLAGFIALSSVIRARRKGAPE